VRDSGGFNPEVRFLANRGYAVFQMNCRGSTDYGRKFWEASLKQWRKTMQTDETDGVQWLMMKGFADPKRIAVCYFLLRLGMPSSSYKASSMRRWSATAKLCSRRAAAMMLSMFLPGNLAASRRARSSASTRRTSLFMERSCLLASSAQYRFKSAGICLMVITSLITAFKVKFK